MRLAAAVIISLVSLIGLLGILFPRIPGLGLIWGGMALYGAAFGFRLLSWPLVLCLGALAGGVRWLSLSLSRRYNEQFGKQGFFILNTIAGSVETLLLFGILLGPLFGLLGWEFLVRRRITDSLPKNADLFFRMAQSTLLELAGAVVLIGVWLLHLPGK